MNSSGDCSIRAFCYKCMFYKSISMKPCKSMGFIYLNKFIYLNTFVIQLVHRCSDNRGSTISWFRGGPTSLFMNTSIANILVTLSADNDADT